MWTLMVWLPLVIGILGGFMLWPEKAGNGCRIIWALVAGCAVGWCIRLVLSPASLDSAVNEQWRVATEAHDREEWAKINGERAALEKRIKRLDHYTLKDMADECRAVMAKEGL